MFFYNQEKRGSDTRSTRKTRNPSISNKIIRKWCLIPSDACHHPVFSAVFKNSVRLLFKGRHQYLPFGMMDGEIGVLNSSHDPPHRIVAPLIEAITRGESGGLIIPMTMCSHESRSEFHDGGQNNNDTLRDQESRGTNSSDIKEAISIAMDLCDALLEGVWSSFSTDDDDDAEWTKKATMTDETSPFQMKGCASWASPRVTIATVSADERMYYDEIQQKGVRNLSDLTHQNMSHSRESLNDISTRVKNIFRDRYAAACGVTSATTDRQADGISSAVLARETACVVTIEWCREYGSQRIVLIQCGNDPLLLSSFHRCLSLFLHHRHSTNSCRQGEYEEDSTRNDVMCTPTSAHVEPASPPAWSLSLRRSALYQVLFGEAIHFGSKKERCTSVGAGNGTDSTMKNQPAQYPQPGATAESQCGGGALSPPPPSSLTVHAKSFSSFTCWNSYSACSPLSHIHVVAIPTPFSALSTSVRVMRFVSQLGLTEMSGGIHISCTPSTPCVKRRGHWSTLWDNNVKSKQASVVDDGDECGSSLLPRVGHEWHHSSSSSSSSLPPKNESPMKENQNQKHLLPQKRNECRGVFEKNIPAVNDGPLSERLVQWKLEGLLFNDGAVTGFNPAAVKAEHNECVRHLGQTINKSSNKTAIPTPIAGTATIRRQEGIFFSDNTGSPSSEENENDESHKMGNISLHQQLDSYSDSGNSSDVPVMKSSARLGREGTSHPSLFLTPSSREEEEFVSELALRRSQLMRQGHESQDMNMRYSPFSGGSLTKNSSSLDARFVASPLSSFPVLGANMTPHRIMAVCSLTPCTGDCLERGYPSTGTCPFHDVAQTVLTDSEKLLTQLVTMKGYLEHYQYVKNHRQDYVSSSIDVPWENVVTCTPTFPNADLSHGLLSTQSNCSIPVFKQKIQTLSEDATVDKFYTLVMEYHRAVDKLCRSLRKVAFRPFSMENEEMVSRTESRVNVTSVTGIDAENARLAFEAERCQRFLAFLPLLIRLSIGVNHLTLRGTTMFGAVQNHNHDKW